MFVIFTREICSPCARTLDVFDILGIHDVYSLATEAGVNRVCLSFARSQGLSLIGSTDTYMIAGHLGLASLGEMPKIFEKNSSGPPARRH